MDETYKFASHNATDLLERGKKTYGSKVDNSVCECPVCYGGGKMGLFACSNCKGTGKIENKGAKDGKEVLEHQEDEQCEGKSPVKTKKKVGPYFEGK